MKNYLLSVRADVSLAVAGQHSMSSHSAVLDTAFRHVDCCVAQALLVAGLLIVLVQMMSTVAH